MLGNKKRRRRRSELRLGTPAVKFETVADRPKISFGPILQFWQNRGPKVIAIFLLAVIVWTGYTLFTTPSFFVYGAQIRGNEALSDREIYLASQVDRQSIFWVNPEKIESQIATLPNVKSVYVSVALPRQVTIDVVERQPELLWQTGQEIWWIDKEGTVVPPKTEVEEMLKIIDDDMQPLEAGYKIDPTIIKGSQALRLLAPNVSIIRHTRAQGLIVSTPEGWPVFLGDGSEMRAKLVVLSTLLPDLREEENPPLYIDLRNPLRPVYKLKPEIKPLPALLPRAPLLPSPWQGSRSWPAPLPQR
jgi:cell division protein FtsQ